MAVEWKVMDLQRLTSIQGPLSLHVTRGFGSCRSLVAIMAPLICLATFIIYDHLPHSAEGFVRACEGSSIAGEEYHEYVSLWKSGSGNGGKITAQALGSSYLWLVHRTSQDADNAVHVRRSKPHISIGFV